MENPSPDKLTIETPEQIPLEFSLAGIGSRFLALALDTLIQVFAGALLVIFGLAILVAGFALSPRGGLWGAAVFLLLLFLLQFGYFAFFEAIWNGQTPGKRLLHLRVIKDTGRPATPYEAVSRNLLRIVDSLPGFYAVGIVSALLSPQHKRLGDYVAGTVVVHEKPLEQQAQVSWDFTGWTRASGYDLGRLSAEEFQLIEAFLLRRTQLTPDVRAQLAGQITQRLAAKLEIRVEDQANQEALLERLATEYRNRARFR